MSDPSNTLTPDQQKLFRIFHPLAAGKEAEFREKRTRFVYYTSAEVATQMIRRREVWMRKSSLMNDYSEMHHGWDCLIAAWNGIEGTQLHPILNSSFPGLFQELEKDVNGLNLFIRLNTFLFCMSEHRDQEDGLGRLSMWRAYGGNAGVAVVLNNSVFITPNDYVKAYASPVAYCDRLKFAEEFRKVIDNIESEIDFLKEKGRELVKNYLFRVLAFAVICTKHPGFAEELEWRVIHCPWWEPSTHLVRAIEVIKGVPQPVYKVPLKNVPGQLEGIDIPELLDQIIIGPTRDPQPTQEAFMDLLAEAGVTAPDKKVLLSNIPLRQW
jgi:hypothetical protein